MDKIICIGKNYLDHAKELGDSIPETPVLFIKPPSVLIQAKTFGDKVKAELPTGKGEIHHECEIAIRINEDKEIDAVTLGLDMTLRDVQSRLKKNGHPWEVSKVFWGSAILGPWILISEFPDYLKEEFIFQLNGRICQKDRGTSMRLSPDHCVAQAADHFPLCKGDVFFTGTPAGVGPVHVNDFGQVIWGNRNIFEIQWNVTCSS